MNEVIGNAADAGQCGHYSNVDQPAHGSFARRAVCPKHRKPGPIERFCLRNTSIPRLKF